MTRATTRSTARPVTTLRIDWTRCDGHGLCAALLPEHIGRDEWGFPVLPEPSVMNSARVDPDLLTEVVHACPALALRLERATAGSPAR